MVWNISVFIFLKIGEIPCNYNRLGKEIIPTVRKYWPPQHPEISSPKHSWWSLTIRWRIISNPLILIILVIKNGFLLLLLSSVPKYLHKVNYNLRLKLFDKWINYPMIFNKSDCKWIKILSKRIKIKLFLTMIRCGDHPALNRYTSPPWTNCPQTLPSCLSVELWRNARKLP